MPGLESQGWRSRFPSSDARLTQARTHSGRALCPCREGIGHHGETSFPAGRRFSSTPRPPAAALPGENGQDPPPPAGLCRGRGHRPSLSGVPLSLDGSGASP